MSRYIDAEALKNAMLSKIPEWYTDDIIDEQPTVDAVQVVRCKDCIWHGNYISKSYCRHTNCQTKDDFYCADGERRTECNKQ